MIRHPELKGKTERIVTNHLGTVSRVHKSALAPLWAYGMQFCVFGLPSSKLSSANECVAQVL